MALLGGFKITKAQWVSPTAIRVSFSTSYGTAHQYQLYAGRELIGATLSTSERSVTGQLKPSAWPQHLTIVAVDPAERLTDYGATLPPRPFNRVKLTFSTSSWPADAEFIEVTGGTEPGGSVDPNNLLARVLYDTDREYEITTPPLAGSGVWNFSVAGRDNRPGGGNLGTAATAQATVTAHPPDVALVGGNRFSVAIEAGVATVSWSFAA